MADPERGKIPLSQGINTRDGTLTKDAKMVNCYTEVSSEGKSAVKRPGTSFVSTFGAGGTPQGQFLLSNEPYFINNDTVYNLTTGVGVAIPSVTTALQQYTTLSDTPYAQSYIKSTSGLWQVRVSAQALVITKVFNKSDLFSYPDVTVSGLSYLDGTYYVMDSEGKLYGSKLQDATLWPALNFIAADATLGLGVGVVRHLNYLVAFYTHGTQFYYDAGLPEGLPIAPVSNAAWTTGCAAGSSFRESSDVTFFISRTRQYGRTVSKFEGLSLGKISTPYIEKILDLSTLEKVSSFTIKIGGHTFYAITLPDLNVTLVYDVDFQDWHLWQSVVAGSNQGFTGINYLGTDSQDLFQDSATGQIMTINTATYVDANGPINVLIRTPDIAFGTSKQKRFASVFVAGDTVATNVYLSYSDDDYQTFSTPRAVNLGTVRKMLQRCGMSRKRSWDVTHQDNTALRLIELEVATQVAGS